MERFSWSIWNFIFYNKPIIKENKFNEAEEYVEFCKKIIEVFEFGEYYKYQLDLSLAKEKRDKDKTIEMIIKIVSEANSMKSNLYRHMKFNVNSSISKDKYEKMVKEAIKKDKTLDFVKNDSRIKSILL